MTSRGFGRRPSRGLLVTVIIFIIAGAAGAVLWSLPTGTGEYQAAPNKKWTAHLSHLSRGTLRGGGRADYAEAKVEDTQTGRVLWRMEYVPQNAPSLPDYGDRSQHFIKWADDSASVTFFFGGGMGTAGAKKLTVPVSF